MSRCCSGTASNVRGLAFDSMLASYLLDATRPGHPLAGDVAGAPRLQGADGRGRVRPRRQSAAAAPNRAGGAAQLRGRARRSRAAARRAAGAAARHRWPRARLSRARDAAGADPGRHGARRHPRRSRRAGAAVGASRTRACRLHDADLRARRRAVQHQLAAAARATSSSKSCS